MDGVGLQGGIHEGEKCPSNASPPVLLYAFCIAQFNSTSSHLVALLSDKNVMFRIAHTEHIVSYHLISMTLISVPVCTRLLPQPWRTIHDAQLCPCLYLSASPALACCTRFQSSYFYNARCTPFSYHLISATLRAVPVCTCLLLQPWRAACCTRFHFFVLLQCSSHPIFLLISNAYDQFWK